MGNRLETASTYLFQASSPCSCPHVCFSGVDAHLLLFAELESSESRPAVGRKSDLAGVHPAHAHNALNDAFCLPTSCAGSALCSFYIDASTLTAGAVRVQVRGKVGKVGEGVVWVRVGSEVGVW